MANFRAILQNERHVRNRLRAAGDKLADMRYTHSRAAVLLFNWVMRNFRAEGGLHNDASLKWPPLALSTKLSRIRRNLRTAGLSRNIRSRRRALPIAAGVTPMLVDKGILRGGFVPRWTNRTAELENYVPYAHTHEFGSGRIPRRKMLPTPAQALELVRPIYGEHVKLSIR